MLRNAGDKEKPSCITATEKFARKYKMKNQRSKRIPHKGVPPRRELTQREEISMQELCRERKR